MLRALSGFIKLGLFSIVILLAGEWAHWDGKTLSQHVQDGLFHVEKSDAAAYVRGLTRRVTEDARQGFDKKMKQRDRAQGSAHASNEIIDRTPTQASAPQLQKSELHAAVQTEEQIPPSERQKLRALIRQLNSSDN